MANRNGITEEEYLESLETRQHVLNTEELFKAGDVLMAFKGWLVYRPPHEYCYSTFNERPVLEHLLIIPINDAAMGCHHIDGEFLKAISWCEHNYPGKSAVSWKNHDGRSIKKWHAHFLQIGDKNV